MEKYRLLEKLNCHCRECGSTIYCSDVPTEIAIRKGLDKLEQNDPYDYWYFCSNPDCVHHEGFGMDDMYYNHEHIDDSWIVKDS